MANYYWVGGAGTWDNSSNTNWRTTSGGTTVAGPPLATDTAIFDANSGTGAVTIASTATCSVLNFGGSGITATLNANNSSIAPSSGFNITAGSFSTSTYNLSTGVLSHTGGTFISGGTLTTAGSLSSSGTTARVMTIGNCTVNSNSVSFSGSNCTFTHTPGTTISQNNGYPNFNGNGYTFYNVTFSNTGMITCTITGANTFNNLSFAGKSTTTVSTVTFNSNQTINGTLTVSAPTTAGSSRYYIQSATYGAAITLTGNTASLTDVDFRDITHSGTTWTGTRLGDAGGNSGITFNTPKTVYWNLAGSQNWNATGWATTTSGAPATTNFPLPQDTAVFTNSNPAAGSTVTLNVAYNLPTIDFSSRSNTLTFATGTITPYAYGSITLSSAITLTGTGAITWGLRSGTATITSAGKTWTQPITMSGIGATLQFGDAFSSSSALAHSYGTLTATSYNVTCTSFTSISGYTRSLNLGSGTWTITGAGATWNTSSTTGMTFNAGTSTISMSSASAKSFSGGGLTFYNLNQGGAGALTISGSNTFNNITNSVQPTTITFTASTTQTLTNFSLSGTAGNLVTINSSTAGTQATLSKTSGTVSCDYLSIQDSGAQGGASWYAGAHSTNVSNNTGWIFTAAPIVNSNFLMFF